MAYDTSAQAFFQGILPTQLHRLPPMEGQVEFQLAGIDGGDFCVDFTRRQVTEGKAPSPAAIVRATATDFMALLEGRMSVNDGLITRRLALSGEPVFFMRMLEALAAVANRPRVP